MKHYFVIETPEQLRVVSDPLRIRLLTMLITQEATGKQLGDQLQMPASKVHYHLRELESHGFIEVVRTQEKNGIVQKFYRAAAIDYVLSEDLLPSAQFDPSVMQEVLANQLRMALSRVYETREEYFHMNQNRDDVSLPLLHGMWEVRADREKLLAWQLKYQALMGELGELDQARTTQDEGPKETEVGTEEIFFMTSIGFLTDIENFKVEEPGSPKGYRIDVNPRTGEVTAKQEVARDDSSVGGA